MDTSVIKHFSYLNEPCCHFGCTTLLAHGPTFPPMRTFSLLIFAFPVLIRCDIYRIGVGIGDVTGPAAQINMMGYALVNQVTQGIHIRTFSRAFIFADQKTQKPIVFVSVDLLMVATSIKLEVVSKLKEKYGDLYNTENVCISAQHTHSAPGGYDYNFLYQITAGGFCKQSLDAIVSGIVTSIERAHNGMKLGKVFWNSGELVGASINRSPTAYYRNVDSSRFEHNIDPTMFQLKLTDLDGKPMGIINWFAVHQTNMKGTNRLISGDNKGYASQMFERAMNGLQLPGKGTFVAAFAQSNEGDSSPNLNGAICLSTGLPCEPKTLTCNGNVDECSANGPGKTMFESTKMIGDMQLAKAKILFNSTSHEVSGDIRFIHQHVEMGKVVVELKNNTFAQTCSAAIGHSFAAGTTDQPGQNTFRQGTIQGEESIFWDFVGNTLLTIPSEEQEHCHYPKPVLLNTGQTHKPYDWTSAIVPTQILMLGNIIIVAVPGEFTTMAGRRIREAVKETLQNQSPNSQVVIAGLSNCYTHYVTTFEEYQVQNYEGASTLFGPHTLQAYIQQYKYLASNIAQGKSVEPGPPPPNSSSKQLTIIVDPKFDFYYPWNPIGDVIVDADEEYKVGSTVSVVFACGNPRHDLQLEGTFLTVELHNGSHWEILYTDASWETKFKWRYSFPLLRISECTIEWETSSETKLGTYRIRHFGHTKLVKAGSQPIPYETASQPFRVVYT